MCLICPRLSLNPRACASTCIPSQSYIVCLFLVLYRIFSLFRFHQIKQQYDLKVHEAELVQARLKQSTHHHQLEEVEALQKTVGKSSVVFICNRCYCYNA